MTAPILQVYTFGTANICNREHHLTPIINKGYNIPRYQFNVITTSRVKGSIQESFAIKDLNDAYMCVLLAPPNMARVAAEVHVATNDDGHVTRQKLVRKYAHSALDMTAWDLQPDVSVGGATTLALPIGQDLDDRFLGMACLKPHEGSYEITGFFSFYPRAGSLLLRFCDYWVFDHLQASQIWITAIHEHMLREMYEKFGYSFLHKVLVPIKKGGAGKSELLEDGIGASRDFHLDVMVKECADYVKVVV